MSCHRTAAWLLLLSSFAQAQLKIENPQHQDVPESQAQALFQTTTQVLEAEFHTPGALENTFRMRLVLGDKAERFTIDDPQGNGTLYMDRWNEGKFAVATMRLAIQHLLGPERQKRMLDEIVKRTREVAPVSAADLRREKIALPMPPSLSPCIQRITDAAIGGTPCPSGDGVHIPAKPRPF